MIDVTKEKLIEDVHSCFTAFNCFEDFFALRKLLKKYLEKGADRQEMVDILSEYATSLSDQRKENEEELVLDGICMLTGWISERWKL